MNAGGIRALYAYNSWANRSLWNALQLLKWQDFTKDLGASHGSIRGTLVHILWGEWLWLRRWRGESPKQVFAPEEFSDWAALESQWRAVEEEQNAFLGRLTDELLLRRVSYDNLEGLRWAYSLAEMMQHLVNHSSYHRGQVAVLLRQHGQAPPATDFLVFLDEQRALDAGGGS
jgi:uncharacterized damage-inducible protein DinB